MDNQSKAYSIIMYLIWPFSAVLIGLKYFDSNYGRKLLTASYAFLGFTAISVGDLERYEDEFYRNQLSSFADIVANYMSLQTHKLYNDVVSTATGIIFDSHHYYFLLLFLIYGFLYVKTIHLLKEVSLEKSNWFDLIFFFGLFLFMLVRPIPNLAYYTGGVFTIFMAVSYYKTNEKKYLGYMLLAPLFHLGLAIYLIVPVLLLVFKSRTWLYVAFVALTFGIGKSNFVGFLEKIAQSNTGTVIESKYRGYASEKGQARLEKRYAQKESVSNIKYKSLNFIQESIWHFFVPLGMALLFLKRKSLVVDDDIKRLFHVSLLFWSIANLMLNISQGERFVVLSCLLSIGLFYIVYIRSSPNNTRTVFHKFLGIFVPILFIFGVMTGYASNSMLPAEFFISNYFLEFFKYTF